MTAALAICVLLISLPAHAWTEDDTKRQLTFTTVSLIDFGQTLNMTERYDEGYYEQNKLLGEYPSKSKITTMGLAWIGGHYLVARWLSPERRYWWQMIGIGGHSIAVVNNVHRGLEIDDSVKPLLATVFVMRWEF
jgi:hypothetical protein